MCCLHLYPEPSFNLFPYALLYSFQISIGYIFKECHYGGHQIIPFQSSQMFKPGLSWQVSFFIKPHNACDEVVFKWFSEIIVLENSWKMV